jgi:hypothetical protein
MSKLDLRAPSITIKFDKGKDLTPIFYYLAPDDTIINLSTYSARMQAKLDYAQTVPTWDLDTELKGGLDIVTGTAVLDDGTLIPGAYGIQMLITDTQTAALTSDIPLYFDIELVGGGLVLPFLKGMLIPYAEVTI